MLKKITIPNIGDFKNVDIIEIAVKTGERVKKDQTLITLETDKAAMEIPSPDAGIIKELSVKIGDKLSQGDVFLVLELEDIVQEKTQDAQTKAATQEPMVQPAAASNTQASVTTSKKITIPNIGDFKNVDIIEVVVKLGEIIKKDQTLITVETDKAAMEIPSPDAGLIKEINVKVGDKVSQGDLILVLESELSTPENADVSNTITASTPTPVATSIATPSVCAPINVKSAEPVISSAKVHAGPATRRLAYELGVDLSQVTGSGQKGRIIKSDIYQYVKLKLTNPTNPSMSVSGLAVDPMPEIDFSKWGEVETQAVKRIQKLSAKFLHRNWVSIPHVTHFDEADITELEAFRQETKAQAEKVGLKLTPIVFLMKSVVSALKQYPQFNSSLSPDGQTLILKKYFHIGVAVDTPDGLVVPVIRDVDQKGIYDLAKELGLMSAKAREGKLTSADMQGGCFTLSSLGGIGGTNFTPIINAPEVAILGISKSMLKPVYKNGNLEPRLLLPLSLSYDHRVIDGAQAARFLAALAAQLSDIRMLLL